MKSRSHFSYWFIALALVSLGLAITFGVLAAIQYVSHDFLKSVVAFNHMRPLHVTSAVSWIVLSATGGVYYYISQEDNMELHLPLLGKLHFYVFLFTGIAIYLALLFGQTGGREYLVFSPFLIIPILFGWIIFGYNYFKTVLKNASKWPVYYWMWGTGTCFMTYHLIESNLWVFEYFRSDYIKDFSIQWKSYGSFVGAWNQLVYGTAIYLMARIKNDSSVGRGKLAFFFYFLGMCNLIFGWAHHTYIVPMPEWIRFLAYGTSMTEWIILFYMIWDWKKSIKIGMMDINSMAYRFLVSADKWVFLNLLLALLISIPALNLYTHGTHITVAHSMGTTIGINTSILFASMYFILMGKDNPPTKSSVSFFKWGFHLFNASLALFLTLLFVMGISKGIWQYSEPQIAFTEFQDNQYLYFVGFLIAGILLSLSIILLISPLLKRSYSIIFKK
ncbi:MAG: hypothetical protein CL840_21510 [Crocinitomicaceae bacterium]|nr:hypothetical protein [Crocinitomicaceae bacterium]|tara:strand:+ start:1990 stop:3327 length:1338 start_codon:yes stop_codon:yes gene_type:complete